MPSKLFEEAARLVSHYTKSFNCNWNKIVQAFKMRILHLISVFSFPGYSLLLLLVMELKQDGAKVSWHFASHTKTFQFFRRLLLLHLVSCCLIGKGLMARDGLGINDFFNDIIDSSMSAVTITAVTTNEAMSAK